MRKQFAVMCAAVALVAAGCGDDDDSSSSPAAGGDSAYLEKVDARVEKLLGKGTYTEPKVTGTKTKPNAKVELVSCGQNVSSCASLIAGAREAAGELGWKASVFDTKGDPSTAGTGIRQAIVSGVDGIFMYAIDCSYVRGALREAKKAEIPVINSEGQDCNQADPGAEPLFTHSITYAQGDAHDWLAAYWKGAIDYAIAKKDGKAKILFFNDDTVAASKFATKQVQGHVATCAKCSIETVSFPLTAIGTDLQGRAEQALLKNPDVNVVVSGYEAISSGGVAAALRSSRQDALFFVGESGKAAMDLVRSGQGTWGNGLALEWSGWAGIDALRSLIDGQEPGSSGIGVQLFDKSHNLPAKGAWVPPVDYAAAYRDAWAAGD